MKWANLIVPSVISIIGFVVTYLSMCKQFKDSIKQQLTEEQSAKSGKTERSSHFSAEGSDFSYYAH